MQTYIDKKQLEEVLKQFNIITKLKVTVFDDKHNVLAEYPKSHCHFCEYVNLIEAGKALCEESNWKAFDICKAKKSTYIYECYLGLIEAVVPLLKNDQIIGYFMFGQITSPNNQDKIKEKIHKMKNIINYDRAISLLTSVKEHNLEEIKAMIKIVEICCMYFIVENTITVKEDKLSSQILDYIEKHALGKFDINDLCKSVNFSRTQIYNVFKKANKIGIMEYIRNYRLKKATELLHDGSYSINEIAQMTGFCDANHFIKLFKEKYKITPKQYMKKI